MQTIDHEPYLLWLLVLGLLLYLPLSVQARDVYKWVDSNGLTHYSQTPPKQAETQTEIVQLDITKPEIKPVDQTLSTLEIANQFERARLAREKARFDRRLALARLDLETQRSDELEQDDEIDVRYVSVVYPRFKHRHKHRHKNCKSKRYPGCGKARDRHQQLRKKHELVTTRSNKWRQSEKPKLNY